MRQHPLMRIGIVLIAAAALFWVGAAITALIEGIVPLMAGAGAILVFIGLALGTNRYKRTLIAAAKAHWRERERVDQPG
jgi:predicted tellurium resistance membrane protein TerC